MHFSEFMSGSYKLGLVITGGGTQAISMLLEEGGMSNVLEFAYVPYSYRLLKEFISDNPDWEMDKACSGYIANKMAHACFDKLLERNNTLGIGQEYLVAVGATFSLVKRGDERLDRLHEGYVALVTNDGLKEEVWKFDFAKIGRSRHEEEVLASQLIISKLQEFMGFNEAVPFTPLGVKMTKAVNGVFPKDD